MANIPMRPPMPPMPMDMDNMHRTLPTSPYDIDPREARDSRDPRTVSGPFDARMEGPDYFSTVGMGSFSGRPPFAPPRFEGDIYTMGIGNQQQHIDDLVRRTNLMVQFVNSQISHAARYGQLQPKMTCDAKFPPEFRVPRTVEEIRAMDPSMIDRLLRAYGLPTDLRSLRMTSQDNSVRPGTAHQARLCTLFDFLGATQISERQRMRRNGGTY